MATIPGLVDKAMADGMNAIALTDHGNMFGIKEFYNYIQSLAKKAKEKIKPLEEELSNENLSEEKKSDLQGKIDSLRADYETKKAFKPILGVEAYVARRGMQSKDKQDKSDRGGWHLILLAKNEKGYKNLCKLVSASWIDGFYYKPRIDKELLEQYKEGLIVCSACLGGEIPQKLLGGSARDVDDEETTGGGFEESVQISGEGMLAAQESILWFKSIFGDDFYLEVQRHKTDKAGGDTRVFKLQQAVNAAIMELAKQTNTKVVATNDVHFVEEEHADAHDRLICLSTGKDIDDPNRMHYTKQEWLKTDAQMRAIFADMPEVLENTAEIVEKIEHYSIDSDAIMPTFEIPADFGTLEEYKEKISEEDLKQEFGDRFEALATNGLEKIYRIKLEADYLEKLTLEGAKARYGEEVSDEIMERIHFELDTMKMMGFPGYFLIVQDFINEGRKKGISFGPGRGSAAGSIVAYCLRITDIDPLKYDLLFERFLNPDRISMPDIDVDIETDGRGSVLQYVTEKYGSEKVARIITYGTMGAKSAIKDVARVQKLPLEESNRLTKLMDDDALPEDVGESIRNYIEYVPALKEAASSEDENLSSVFKYADLLEGTVRQVGVHACGVIIGSDDLSKFLPLCTADDKETKEKVTVTQYEGGVMEEVGLIKMDFLGLETLDIIKETLKNIKKTKGIDLDIDHIPLDDKDTYELFSKGQTVGIFQFESPGMQKHLRELQPTCLDDLIAMNALYRPGPMLYIQSFIRRKQGEEPIDYDIPIMEKRLKETYGITVYQEQVMLLSRDLAGFTRGQSDVLRKVMGKKQIDKMAPLKEKFFSGGIANGHAEKVLEKIWTDWEKFAEYAFNKSHSTCYAYLAYQTGYLKAHYPCEFMSALLTRKSEKAKEVRILMGECRSMRMLVKGPDINESDLYFTPNKSGDIRFGLAGIKSVGAAAVETIIKERETNGAFKSIFDFVERINLNSCNKRTIEALANAGAFDTFSEIQREQFFAERAKDENFIDVLIRYGNQYQNDKRGNINSIFSGFEDIETSHPDIPPVGKSDIMQRLNKEKEYIGIYLSAHPLDEFRTVIDSFCRQNLSKLKEPNIKKTTPTFAFSGLVIDAKEQTSQKGGKYGKILLEDFEDTYELMLFGKNYENFWELLNEPYKAVYIESHSALGYGKSGNEEDDFKMEIDKVMNLSDLMYLTRRIDIEVPLYEIDYAFAQQIEPILNNSQEKSGGASVAFKVYDVENKRETILSTPVLVNTKKFVPQIQKILTTANAVKLKK
jgi:DNA polymerase-3 subunit alpha